MDMSTCRNCVLLEDGTLAPTMDKSIQTLGVLIWNACNYNRFLGEKTPFRFWCLWMEDYSKRSFTYERDRVPALAGVVLYHKINTKGTPMLGLWKETFDHRLQWLSNNGGTASPSDLSQTHRSLSWTWLSAKTPISSPKSLTGNSFYDDVFYKRLTVEKWGIRWSGHPYTSQLQSIKLRFRAKVKTNILDSDSYMRGFTIWATKALLLH